MNVKVYVSPSSTLKIDVLSVGKLIVAVLHPSSSKIVNSTLSSASIGENTSFRLPPLSAIVIVFYTLTVYELPMSEASVVYTVRAPSLFTLINDSVASVQENELV